MKKLSKLFVIPGLIMALVFAFIIPSKTMAAETEIDSLNEQVKELSDQEMQELIAGLKAIYAETVENSNSETPTIEVRGYKSKAALKVAEMLLKSGNKVVDLLKDLGLLDAAAAKSFKKVTGKVGNFVETLASAGDEAAAMARTQLPKKLNDWGIKNKGTQEMIANAVSYAIKAADWIFL